jgi:methyl-accepting chemotaxis protein
MLKNIKLGPKLIGSFIVVSLIAMAIGIFGYVEIHKIDDADTFLYEKTTVPLGQMCIIVGNFNRVRLAGYRVLIAQNIDETKKAAGRSEFLWKGIKTNLEGYSKTLINAEDEANYKKMKSDLESFEKADAHLLELKLAGKDDEAQAFIEGQLRKEGLALTDFLDKVAELNVKAAKETSDMNTVVAIRTGRIMIGAAAFGSIFAFILGMIISRSISVPLTILAGQARQVADGDLRTNIDHRSGDEIGDLSEAFRTMTEGLRSTISKVSETSNQVAAASNELNLTAEHIATGAEEVAAQAGTVATAGEEMSATSGDIAQNCQMAAEGAQRASQTASAGAAVVERTVVVMGQIAAKVQESAKTVESLGARSDQIGNIIGTIEDIADQTNLLALNAAIEAARAGEQGRGFAVVADEVRALAERTTRATREIGEMIKSIQKETKNAVIAMEQGVQQVEAGTVEAAKSGQALQDILAQVNDVAMQVNQIATAAEEQTATTSEISSNMMQITEVVQQTSQGAHESATAAAQLSGNAEELQRLVRQFKL